MAKSVFLDLYESIIVSSRVKREERIMYHETLVKIHDVIYVMNSKLLNKFAAAKRPKRLLVVLIRFYISSSSLNKISIMFYKYYRTPV